MKLNFQRGSIQLAMLMLSMSIITQLSDSSRIELIHSVNFFRFGSTQINVSEFIIFDGNNSHFVIVLLPV